MPFDWCCGRKALEGVSPADERFAQKAPGASAGSSVAAAHDSGPRGPAEPAGAVPPKQAHVADAQEARRPGEDASLAHLSTADSILMRANMFPYLALPGKAKERVEWDSLAAVMACISQQNVADVEAGIMKLLGPKFGFADVGDAEFLIAFSTWSNRVVLFLSAREEALVLFPDKTVHAIPQANLDIDALADQYGLRKRDLAAIVERSNGEARYYEYAAPLDFVDVDTAGKDEEELTVDDVLYKLKLVASSSTARNSPPSTMRDLLAQDSGRTHEEITALLADWGAMHGACLGEGLNRNAKDMLLYAHEEGTAAIFLSTERGAPAWVAHRGFDQRWIPRAAVVDWLEQNPGSHAIFVHRVETGALELARPLAEPFDPRVSFRAGEYDDEHTAGAQT